MIRFLISSLPAALLLLLPAGPAAPFTFAERDAGADAHPAVLTRHGGAYYFPALSEYVNQVGARLAAQTEEPAENWTFTILDTPTLTAFAQPGGYVYVSRGLLALLNSEAELAAVLAHQMAHVLADHVPLQPPAPATPHRGLSEGALLDGLIGGRPEGDAPNPFSGRNTGAAPDFDLSMELAAARPGVEMLAAAGYPPNSAIELLRRLQTHAGLANNLDGAGTVALLGSTGPEREEIATAIRLAADAVQTGSGPIDDGRRDFLLALQGLLYGDSPDHGLIRDGSFIHPNLHFAFDLPEGYVAEITAAEVIARGPGGAVMVLDTTDRAGSRLQSYLRDSWAPSLTRNVSSGYLYDLQAREIGGFDAASAFQPYDDETGPKVAQLVVIRTDERIYRFRNVAPAEDIAASLEMEAAVDTFRQLPLTASTRYNPYWLQIHEVRRGDSMNLFAAAMPLRDGAESRFRVLNGYDGAQVPVIGDLVKLVMEE
ncbi:M48 family metalloprotease [Halovulum sp. GXIMD14794]